MESKIPYKKYLVIKTDEEIDNMEAKEKKEQLDKSISDFDKDIARAIRYVATETKQRYVAYNLRDIKDFTYKKENQKIILETIQLELTKKGYINYVANIKFDDNKLIILLDDKVKSEADKYIRDVNKSNIKFMILMPSIFLIPIVIAILIQVLIK